MKKVEVTDLTESPWVRGSVTTISAGTCGINHAVHVRLPVLLLS